MNSPNDLTESAQGPAPSRRFFSCKPFYGRPCVSAILVLIVQAFFLFFSAPFLLDASGKVPAGDDSYASAWLDASLFDQALRSSLQRYHAVAYQNPFIDGGIPLGAHPADGSLSPLTLIFLRFDALTATKLKSFLAVLAGMFGLYLLAKKMGARPALALIASFYLPVSGQVRTWLLTQPLSLSLLFTLPAFAVVLFSRLCVTHALIAAFFIALASFQSGSLILYVPLAFVFIALIQSRDPEARTRTWKLVGRILVFASLFSAVKWFPTLELLTGNKLREAAALTQNQAGYEILNSLKLMLSNASPAGPSWLSIPLIVLVAIGSHYEPRLKKFAPALLIFIILGLLPHARGTSGLPAWWITSKPLAQSDFAASVFVLAFAASLAALAIERIITSRRNLGFFAGGLFLSASILPIYDSFQTPLRNIPEKPIFRFFDNDDDKDTARNFTYFNFQLPRGARPSLETHPTLIIKKQLGVKNALPDFKGAQRVLPGFNIDNRGRIRRNKGYQGDVRLIPNNGELSELLEGANYLVIKGKMERDKINLVFNRNYSPSWKFQNRSVNQSRGLISIPLKNGENDIRVTYTSPRLLFGVFISCLAFLSALGFAIFENFVHFKTS